MATNTGHTTLEQAKTTIDEHILSQTTKARLRYKRVDFLGMANRGFRKMLTSYIHLTSCPTYLATHKSQTLPQG